MERAVQVGGAGTPRIAEFAYAELGARMQMGPWSAKRYVADALDVRHRLPLVWARVVAREARIGNARLVATRTRHLSVEAAAVVDAAMAPFVDGSLPWGRFEARLAGRIVAADPEAAAAREAERPRKQFAKRTRSSEHGTAGFYVRSTVGVIARVEATVAFLADALKAFGDRDAEDVRRVKALVLMANPVKAVELLAAFAALRARCVDVELPDPADPADPSEMVSTGSTSRSVVSTARPAGGWLEPSRRWLDARPAGGWLELDQPGRSSSSLGRMDAFARRVGFEPRRLPPWLTARSDDGPGASDPPVPRFGFDWSQLLPPLTMYLHLSVDDLAAGGTGWSGGRARDRSPTPSCTST